MYICNLKSLALVNTCLWFHYLDNNDKGKCCLAIKNTPLATFPIWLSTQISRDLPGRVNTTKFYIHPHWCLAVLSLSNCNAERSQAATILSTPPPTSPVCCMEQTYFLCGFPIKTLLVSLKGTFR